MAPVLLLDSGKPLPITVHIWRHTRSKTLNFNFGGLITFSSFPVIKGSTNAQAFGVNFT